MNLNLKCNLTESGCICSSRLVTIVSVPPAQFEFDNINPCKKPLSLIPLYIFLKTVYSNQFAPFSFIILSIFEAFVDFVHGTVKETSLLTIFLCTINLNRVSMHLILTTIYSCRSGLHDHNSFNFT